jgi:peptidoglycan hydrolase-like protein with peptidoglycan-binding domain
MKPVEQFQNAQLVRQQQVLAHLGYYKGRIDGIWGPGTIKAKKEFEAMGFAPGVPNGGLPFASRGPYPKGIFMSNGLLDCGGFDASKYPVYNPNAVFQKPPVQQQKPEPKKSLIDAEASAAADSTADSDN